MNYKGIITKLEFKAMLYFTGLTKSSIVDIISMLDYFSISYVNCNKQVTKKDVSKSELQEIINNHSKSLLMFN